MSPPSARHWLGLQKFHSETVNGFPKTRVHAIMIGSEYAALPFLRFAWLLNRITTLPELPW